MKKRYKAVLIDDEELNKLTPITDRLSKTMLFNIEILQPKTWDSRFIKELNSISNTCDCIILDWRLDQHMISDGYNVTYKGAELCQLIRRKAAEKKFRSLPVFLWSTDQNLGHSYTDDFTSHDLFDRIYKKDKDLRGPDLIQSGKEMIYFIEFYKLFRSIKRNYNVNDFLSILGLTDGNAHWLDERAKEFLIGLLSYKTPRIPMFSRFIYRDIIRASGILISENLLAARLGVDTKKSKGWKNVLDHKAIKAIQYDGFFESDEQPLFWMQGLYEFWLKAAPNENSLFITPAEKRVESISDFLNIDRLTPLNGKGKYFWYLDNVSGNPIDPDYGKQDPRNVKFTWQDPLFVSNIKLKRK